MTIGRKINTEIQKAFEALSVVIVMVVLAWMIWGLIEDHFRLIQVRQMLKDHGTPIQMDVK